MRQICGLGIAVLWAALLSATTAQARNDDPIPFSEDKFKVAAGGFFTNFNSSMKIDANENDANAAIDVEDDLGLNASETTFRIDAYWRPRPRHRLTAGYYRLDREGATRAETDIEWEDNIYPAGALIDSGLKLGFIPFSYAYSFVKTDKIEIAASFGAHWIDYEASIVGTGFVGDDPLFEIVSEDSSLEGPFPLFGLMAAYQPAPRWQIGTSIQYLDISISNYSGQLFDARAYVEYFLWRNVGVGLSYSYFDAEVIIKKTDFVGDFDVQYDGFYGYLAVKF